MTERLKIDRPVIVEGKYDKITLSAVIDAHIIPTGGFSIFNQKEKLALIRRLGEERSVIVLTDSDGAGKLIRSHISNLVPRDRLIQLYIPQIKGKEKRKAEASKEGTLGVEGMEHDLLRNLLAPYADGTGVAREANNPLSKTDFYIDGLSGGPHAADRRDALAAKLALPRGMTANALLAAVRLICTYEEYLALVERDEDA